MKTETLVEREFAGREPQPWILFSPPGAEAIQGVLEPSDPLVARIVWILEETPDVDAARD